MVTKLPDGVLEKLYCDVCYKFLSVKPVKVYPGKKIKCGRCSNTGEDEGVVSLYELIADQCYFPCINRLDGCDILLATSQVATHEKNCESKYYVCPICEDDVQIPTFLMIKHFRDRHKEAVLNTPVFCIDPRESLQVEKWFLYKLNNILFFINCDVKESADIVSLNARYLGVPNKSEIITQKFILHYGSNEIASGEILCFPHNKTDTMGLSISMSSFKQKESFAVSFEINISRLFSKEPTVLAQCDSVIVPTQQATDLKKTLNSVASVHRSEMNASLIEMDLGYSEDDLTKSRMIFPTSTLRNLFSIGPTFDCINAMRIFSLCCFKCGELEYSFEQYGINRVKTIFLNKKIYLTCESCYNCSKAIRPVSEIAHFCHLEKFQLFRFFCIWNCSVCVSIADVRAHEIACDKQPSRLCPVESCIMKGKLSVIETHFEKHSPEYSLSFVSSINVQLIPSKLITKHFLLVRSNVFVYVELTWAKYYWLMKFMLCGEKEKDTFAGMKLKAMAFDSSSGNKFLRLVEYPQILQFPHMETVLIKCFLEK